VINAMQFKEMNGISLSAEEQCWNEYKG